jgi:hypothetical protein
MPVLRRPVEPADPTRTLAGISCCSSELAFAPTKVVISTATMPFPEFGGGHEAAAFHRTDRCGCVEFSATRICPDKHFLTERLSMRSFDPIRCGLLNFRS